MSSEPTTIAAYVYAIIDALEERGADGRAIVESVIGRDLPRYDPTERIPAHTVAQLFSAAVKATGDPYIGLSVGAHVRQKTLHALGYALMASSSLRDFSLRLQRYFRLVSHSAEISIEESSGAYSLVVKVTSESVCNETEDALISVLVGMMREIYTSQFNPQRVDLRRAEPPDGPGPYEDMYQCPVRFDQTHSTIHIRSEDIDNPLPGASKEIAFQNDQIILGYLAKLDRDDIVTQTRMALIEQLSAGNVYKDNIAKRLHMSPRTLQYKLAQAGTSFQDITDETRRDLALRYLDTPDISITQMTFLLGFADTSNFTRAFKRWTGQSPTNYRNQLH